MKLLGHHDKEKGGELSRGLATVCLLFDEAVINGMDSEMVGVAR